ncbi:MAG: glycoside hydrolase family 66 protein [Sporolactobacillus sp.]
MTTEIRYLDVYPDKAQYRPNEEGKILIEIESNSDCMLVSKLIFRTVVTVVSSTKKELALRKDRRCIFAVPFKTREDSWDCIGVDVQFFDGERLLLDKSTAYDSVDHWWRTPRYGFICDYPVTELGATQDISALQKYHINCIQFYDWMYRHDQLVPPESEFTDPMGRKLSYAVVTEKRKMAQRRGMAVLAYGAVYAALKDFFNSHKEWALYQRDQQPFSLIDRFYIMDLSADSQWTAKIISEFKKVIHEGFDGIHLDQYGFPKKAIRYKDNKAEVVDLATCYRAFIDRLKTDMEETGEDAALIFNNVSNYPVKKTAQANQAAIYIEVWPPVKHYYELKALIEDARERSNKQVILSAYLPAFRELPLERMNEAENGAILTMATIFASGGFHLFVGEDNAVLTSAYYPDYARMRPSFIQEVRCYYDFIVRYGKLLHGFKLKDVSMTYTGGINTEVLLTGASAIAPNGEPGKVWSQIKNSDQCLVIHLINFVEIEDDSWDTGKARRPKLQTNILCTVLKEHEVTSVYIASPDRLGGRAIECAYEEVAHEQGRAIQFTIPELKVWNMVIVNWVSEEMH